MLNNSLNHKTIYAALHIKQVPFKMYLKDGYKAFAFCGNELVMKEEEIIINYNSYNNITDVIKFIQEV